MTESQLRFLTSYLGECWIEHDNPNQLIYVGQIYLDKSTLRNRTFTDLKDKQDLLEILSPKDFADFMDFASDRWNEIADKTKPFMGSYHSFARWFILLSPIETAELICKWKGENDDFNLHKM